MNVQSRNEAIEKVGKFDCLHAELIRRQAALEKVRRLSSDEKENRKLGRIILEPASAWSGDKEWKALDFEDTGVDAGQFRAWLEPLLENQIVRLRSKMEEL